MHTIKELDWGDKKRVSQIADIYVSHTDKDFYHEYFQHEWIYFIENEEEIVSFISLHPYEFNLMLSGFTKKKYENRGYFSSLYQFLFIQKKQLQARIGSDDSKLSLDIKTIDSPQKTDYLASKFDWTRNHSNIFYLKDLHKGNEYRDIASKIRYRYLRKDEGNTRMYTVFYKNKTIAHFSLSDLEELGEETVFFHSFEISKKYRRLGHGTRIMKEIFSKLQGDYRYIYLHVFADNIPAITLYKKLGFSEIERYEYFETAI